ncbi:SixA phosphatase family protein [Kiritimatiella glycovorans]|uniref:Phosphohistidine phosphatase n=1 Tax=Kiritimatiella glycovorans TaxID=1307763 RepID=A0A0G3EBN6_9BACT|nr:histidine phosphatase family protein [Kiritimatiella glycovorans]AKJ63866.1 phosphohistidine phosphatase [Kiritimatiella glycovorans]
MKRVTLIRHGKAEKQGDRGTDFDRDLNERGRNDAKKIAAKLKAEAFRPSVIVTSPAVRAAATARYFAEALGAPLCEDPRIFRNSVPDLLEVIRNQEDEFGHIALVGHNPSMEGLLAYLVPGVEGEMSTCEVADIQLDLDRWADVGEGAGSLRASYSPKNMGAS